MRNENFLVISSDSTIGERISGRLEDGGHKAKQVTSYIEALSVLNRESYSSIFADKRMLQVAEHEFVDTVKKIDSLANVIFFAGSDENDPTLKFWTLQYFSVDDKESLAQNLKTVLSQAHNGLKHHLEGLGLTSKQVQILLMISAGECNKAIAQELGISEQGVKYHVGVLLKLFAKTNRKELQKYLSETFRSASS